MATKRTHRIRNYEQLEARALRRRAYDQQSEDGQYLDRPERHLGLNTMEAPDDIYTRRRTRHRVVVAAQGNANGNPLVENVLILLLLVMSIYGLYRLSIYLLSQAS